MCKEFGDMSNFNIIEIGGGYGGQCKILDDIFKFKSYTIIDLPECMQLINKYLSHFKIDNARVVTHTELDQKDCDLIISNYAFSEVDRKGQLKYIEKIISKAPRGYMIYNWQRDQLSSEEFVSIISKFHKNIRMEQENPLTAQGNVTIIWKP